MAVEKILHTLETYDNEQVTITVGGAAIAVHLAEAGIDFATEDVDVLCSADYFANQVARAPFFEPDTVHKFQIRYPYGESHTRALSPVLDIYPGSKTAHTTIPFSASPALGGKWHPTNYEDCLNRPDTIVKQAGYMFLSMAEVLTWTAKTGREKDIAKVDRLLPVSLKHGLVSQEQYQHIQTERNHSAALRTRFPHRHYARVES
jgi:hypothetical protein